MHTYVYLAVALIVLVTAAHSWLGERYVLMRVFKRCQLPRLLGSEDNMRKTLRFAWHITSAAWLGLAAVLVALVQPGAGLRSIALVVSATFLVHFVIALAASRGKHLSWILFLATGLLVGYAALLK
jgi:hypothetical protein